MPDYAVFIDSAPVAVAVDSAPVEITLSAAQGVAGPIGPIGPIGLTGPSGTSTWASITDNPVSITAGKTFSCTGTLTLSGTDGSTLNVGTGGTLGTAAYTAATAYVSSSLLASYGNGSIVQRSVIGSIAAQGTAAGSATVLAPMNSSFLSHFKAHLGGGAHTTGFSCDDDTSNPGGFTSCTINFPATTGTVCLVGTTLAHYGITDAAAATHAHGNITSAGLVGTTANLPLITGTGGIVQAGAFGTGATNFCVGNDSRLSDARTPTAHTHGNLTNAGLVGTTANLPLITGTGGIVQAGAFGTGATDFCVGNDSRLSDPRTPTAHGSDKHNALDVVQFDTTPTVGSHTEGQMFWDTTWKTATLEIQDDINLQIGQETMVYVYNGTGVDIPSGSVVYTAGTQAGVPSVALAQGDSDATSQVLGVVTSSPSIANGAYGFVTIRGHVNDMDTNAWTLGDNLYLDASVAGALTNVKPNTGDYDTRVGRVMLKSATTGRVYVNMVREYRVGAISAGAGVEMFPDDTTIIAGGGAETQSSYPIKTLSKIPVTSAEDVDSITMANSTVLYGVYLNNAAIGQTSIAGGVWDFEIWAGVSSAVNVTSITQNVNRVRAEAGTVTSTGSGTTRTVVASTGTPFATTKIDVGGTIAADSFLQTTTGFFRIVSRVSDTEITITTPSTYTNQTTVAFSVHKKLFGVSTGEINNTAGAAPYAGLQKYSVQSVQAAFTVLATDTLSTTFFGVSDGSRTVYFSHNGTTRYSHFSTPLIALHNDLSGLQGGAASEYYHLTAAQQVTVASVTPFAATILDDATAAAVRNTLEIPTMLRTISRVHIHNFTSAYTTSVASGGAVGNGGDYLNIVCGLTNNAYATAKIGFCMNLSIGTARGTINFGTAKAMQFEIDAGTASTVNEACIIWPVENSTYTGGLPTTQKYFGFKIIGRKCYGVANDGTTAYITTGFVTFPTGFERQMLRAECSGGVVSFWVNGVTGTLENITTGPTGTQALTTPKFAAGSINKNDASNDMPVNIRCLTLEEYL